ncbi:substrate-binding domain-containing protein [Phycisphaerales bacterium AB-hyl4]|uniref:Substrate-binding domain-containing protein n=1 Tax=Natronomicrosphaera hydrolytica TaxID=3242702 RepID=A0ABV4U704_9BACT
MAKRSALEIEIRRDLTRGRYGQVGDPFVSIREMARQKDVSLKTSFLLYETLKAEGWIAREGRGFVIQRIVPLKSNTKKPLLLGCVVPSLDNAYFARLVDHLEEAASRFGANLLVATSHYDFAREQQRLTSLVQHGVNGLLICPRAQAVDEAWYQALKVPCVMIGRRLQQWEVDTIMVNNQPAAQAVAGHLIEQGATRFAYIGQQGIESDERLLGFRAGLLADDLLLEPQDMIQVDHTDHEACEEMVGELLSRRKRGRLGVFCYHDLLATRVLNLCHQRKISVPDQVLIAGFDNLPIARETFPSLTTVRYPIRAMAQMAVEALHAKIQFPGQTSKILRYLEAELIVRGSTAAGLEPQEAGDAGGPHSFLEAPFHVARN